MIRMIAADMDGTLVSSDHTITTRCADSIHRAQQAGIEFIVTTGRVYEETYPQLQAAGIHCKCLVMNGAQLRDETGRILMRQDLHPMDAITIIEQLQEQGLYIELYTNQGIYTMSSSAVVLDAVAVKLMYFIPDLRYDKAIEMVPQEQEYQKLIFTDADHFDFQTIRIGKILSFSSDRELMARMRRHFMKQPGIAASSSFPINLEITCEQAQKGPALKAYAKEQQIKPSCIMTIGDSYNDLSMLSEEFGYTVAMGNAIEEVKQLARYQTLDHDHDGVAHAIETILQ